MDFMAIIWAIIGFFMIIAEFFVPGLVIIFFGTGALLTALLTALIPGITGSLLPQVLIWLGFSTLSLISLRKYFKKIFRGKQITSRDHEYDDGGRTVEVLETVGPETAGRIRYKGTSWAALSFDKTYEPGDKVWILKQEGMTYYVGDPLLPEDDDAGDI